MGKRTGRKFVRGHQDSLISEAKLYMQPKQNKDFYSLLPISGQIFSHFLESRASAQAMVTWEDKPITMNVPPFPELFSLTVLSYGLGYLFGQLASAVPAVFPPKFLLPRSLLAVGAVWETEAALMLCKYYSAIAKILLCYQHYSS